MLLFWTRAWLLWILRDADHLPLLTKKLVVVVEVSASPSAMGAGGSTLVQQHEKPNLNSLVSGGASVPPAVRAGLYLLDIQAYNNDQCAFD